MHRREQHRAARRARHRRRLRRARRRRAAPRRADARRRRSSSRRAAGRGAGRRWGRALGREHLDTPARRAGRRRRRDLLQPWSLQAIDGARRPLSLRLRPTASAAPSRRRAPRLVVAAHGSWEPLRRNAPSAASRARPSDLFAFKANFRPPRSTPTCCPCSRSPAATAAWSSPTTASPLSPAASAPIGCGRVRAAMPGRRAGDAFESMLRAECTGVAAALAGATRTAPGSRPARSARACGSRQSDGLFRVGNAAGEAHPIVGEGISMALQSAFLLAALIGPARRRLLDRRLGGRGASDAQREYAALWRRRFARRLPLAAGFAHIAMRPALAAAAWPLVRPWPGILRTAPAGAARRAAFRKRRRFVAPGGGAGRAAGRVRRLSFSAVPRSTASVAASAGRKVSRASSDSSDVDRRAEDRRRADEARAVPCGVSNTRGTTMSLPPPCGASRSAAGGG